MVEKIYIAVGNSKLNYKIDWDYILVSAATLWSGKRFAEFKRNPRWKEIFLDSGGFTYIKNNKLYPFSISKYISLAERLNARYFATMDYICTEDRGRGSIMNNIKRIEKTVENTRLMIDRVDKHRFVSVIQGYYLDEILYCVDLLRENGLFTAHMGIANIQSKRKLSEVLNILHMLRKEIPDWITFHGFGTDLRFLKVREIWERLHTVDTSSWRFNIDYKKDDSYENSYFMPKTDDDAICNFKKYKRELLKLIARYKAQRKLTDFKSEETSEIDRIELMNNEVLYIKRSKNKAKLELEIRM